MLSCGGCGAGETCDAVTHRCDDGTCTPMSCAVLGAECGAAADGCGATLECGVCGDGLACGDGRCLPYEPDCATRLAARTPDPRIGTASVVVEPAFWAATRDGFCAGEGGIQADIGPEGTRLEGPGCRGRLAREAFRYSICSCNDIEVMGPIYGVRDMRDMLRGPPPIGANGSVRAESIRSVGVLTASGCEGVSMTAALTTSADTQSNGAIVAPTLSIGRDLWSATGIDGNTTVGRDLLLSPGATRVGALAVSGDTREVAVDIPYPCLCDGSFGDDIATAVTAAATSHDEGAPSGGYPPTIACGRHYWTAAEAPPQFNVSGRVAVFIDGDLGDLAAGGAIGIRVMSGSLTLLVNGSILAGGGAFALDVADGAQADIFIAGDLITDGGAAQFGDSERPSAARFYVAGDTIRISGGSTSIDANVYAPNASYSGQGTGVSGSLLVANFFDRTQVSVSYDADVLDIGVCDEPDVPCQACSDCAGTSTCVEGECGECRSDADCCNPLVCVEGECVPFLI